MRILTVIFCLAVLLSLTFEGYLLPSNDARVQPVQQKSTDANTPPLPNYQAPSAIEHIGIDDGKAGFYIETPKSGLPPAPTPYSAIGAYRFWAWSELQDDDGSYTFDEFDKWLNNQLIAGYQAVGLPIYTYTNRWASCSLGDAIFIPKYVERGPDNVAGTVDDPLLIASSLDTRDCDGDGEDDVWYLIDYDDPDFLAQYESFIRALADHILSHPQADKIKWIATGSGRDGETITVDNGDKGDVDLTSEQWIDTVNAITNFYLAENSGKLFRTIFYPRLHRCERTKPPCI